MTWSTLCVCVCVCLSLKKKQMRGIDMCCHVRTTLFAVKFTDDEDDDDDHDDDY